MITKEENKLPNGEGFTVYDIPMGEGGIQISSIIAGVENVVAAITLTNIDDPKVGIRMSFTKADVLDKFIEVLQQLRNEI